MSSVTATVESLVAGAQDERSLAFADFYDAHVDFVWRCLRALGVPEPGLEDAAQDVFLVVHRQLPSFQQRSAARTWLYGIVRNVASNHRRRLRRKGGLEPLDGEAPSLDGDPLERAQQVEAAEFVRHFSGGLDPARREVFVLAMIEEMSMPEVAEALGIPLNTAYTRLRSARLEFKRALAERAEP